MAVKQIRKKDQRVLSQYNIVLPAELDDVISALAVDKSRSRVLAEICESYLRRRLQKNSA
jgi:hypothetical protein